MEITILQNRVFQILLTSMGFKTTVKIKVTTVPFF